MKDLMHNPIGFIDVGARGGVYSILDSIASIVSVLAFEPDKKSVDLLNSKDSTYKVPNQIPFDLIPI